MCLAARATLFLAFVSGAATAPAEVTVPAGAYVRASLPKRVDVGHLRPGAQLDAQLEAPLYAAGRPVISSGAKVRLTVESVARRSTGELGNRVAKAFAFVHGWERTPPEYDITLRSASLELPNHQEAPIGLAVLGVGDQVQASPGGKRGGRKSQVLLARLDRPFPVPLPPANAGEPPSTRAGAQAALVLLGSLGTRRHHDGDSFKAQLVEPLSAGGGLVLPEGTIFNGRVTGPVPARMLHRAGRMRLVLDKVQLPDGTQRAASLSLNGIEANGAKSVTMDSEGGITAGPRSKRAHALSLLTSYVLGKVADDLLEEGIKALSITVAPGTVATAARYVGLTVGAVWFLTQRGRDVLLPQNSILHVSFNRPIEPQP